jgi:hypothetical protein
MFNNISFDIINCTHRKKYDAVSEKGGRVERVVAVYGG